jgi:hypothetical protein
LRIQTFSYCLQAVWDVVLARRPSKRRPNANGEIFPEIIVKYPEVAGRKRLSIRSTSLVLFKMDIKPSSDTEAPYERDCFFDFPINIISTYGKHDRYFFMQVGRCSDFGQGEVWMMCETEVSARAMHERIDEIAKREAERRRELGIQLTLPGVSASTVKSRMHRERSQKQRELEAAELRQHEADLKKAEAARKAREGIIDEEPEVEEEVVPEPDPPSVEEEPEKR